MTSRCVLSSSDHRETGHGRALASSLVGAGLFVASIGGVVLLGSMPSVGAAPVPPPPGATVVGIPAADCPSPTVATIQAAITAAAANDVIYVCAGTYTEPLTINKPLTLLGAQFGVDARTGRTDPASETILDVPTEAITYVAGASTGTIDGFTLQNSNTAIIGIGDDALAYTFQNNVITGNMVGMNIHTVGPDVTLISQNRFVANTKNPADSTSGSSIFITNGVVVGMTVENNLFQGNVGSSAADINTPGSTPLLSSGITVSNNTSIDDDTFFVINDTTGTSVSTNTITHTNPIGASGSAILLFDANPGAMITGNTINGGAAAGIADFSGSVLSGNPTITNNAISNRAVGVRLSQAGATVSANTITNSSQFGIWMQVTAAGGNVTGNTMSSTIGVDCQDDSTGAGTLGTANTWTGNIGITSSPAGLCAAPPPPTTTTTTLPATTTTAVAALPTPSSALPPAPATLPPSSGQLPATGGHTSLRLIPLALLLVGGGIALTRRGRRAV